MFIMPGDRAGRCALLDERLAAPKLILPSTYVPMVEDFTWTNQGSATATNTAAGIVISKPNAAGNSAAILKRSVPAGAPFDVYAKLQLQGTTQQFAGAGLIARDGSGGKLLSIEMNIVSLDPVLNVEVWNSATSVNASRASLTALRHELAPPWLRFNVTSTVITAYYSYDGLLWQSLYAETIATFLGAVNEVGVFVNPNGGVATALFQSFDFRAPE